MDITVIIVNYKTKELTAKAIQSVFDKTEGVEYEITVVDNASNDGSAEYLKQQFGNKINIIESKENLGFGKGNNVAIRQSNAKYIFLLNSDTELKNNAIKIFYDFMEKEENSNVGVCGGNLYDINNNPETSYCMYKNNISSYLYWRFIQIISKIPALITKKKFYCNFNYSTKIKEVGYISGADMFIRSIVLQKSGLFDETTFMYADDVDLNFRIKNAGYNIKSLPSAKIMHIDHASFKEDTDDKILNNYRVRKQNEYKFFYKMFGYKTYFIYLETQISNIIRIMINLLLPKVLLKRIYIKIKSTDLYINMFKTDKEEYKNAKSQYEA